MKLVTTTFLLTLLSAESADTYKRNANTRNIKKRSLTGGGKVKGAKGCQQSVQGCVEANGAQELPTLTTSLTSELDFEFVNSFSEFNYVMYLSGIVSPVYPAHLHCAPASVNGQIALPILPPITANSTSTNITIDGVAVEATITAEDYSLYLKENGSPNCVDVNGNPVKVGNLVSLYSAMKRDLIYLNVHAFAPNEFCGNWLKSRESDRRSRIMTWYVRGRY